jgi:thiol-disulfide isomerase/thioredoxin
MKTLRLLALACAVAPAVLAQDLTLAELARRPELLPAQVSTTKPIKLQNRPAFPVGQKLGVIAVQGTNVQLETPDGRTRFAAPADDTDILAAAQAIWRSLSPEQRALTYAALPQRKDLWTYRVKVRTDMQFPGGTLKPGDAAILVGFEGPQILLVHEKRKFLFNTEPRNTDLLDNARKLIADKNAFPSRVSEDMAGKLVIPATGAPAALDAKAEPKYYVFYRGAGWCGPCIQFSPALVKFDQETRAKMPGAYEIVFFSADRSPADLKAYAAKMGFAWVSLPQSRQPEMQVVNRLFSNMIPQLVVTDRHGAVVIDSAKTGGSDNALKQFAALLKK